MKNITKKSGELETIGNFLSKKLEENSEANLYSVINIPQYQRDYSWNSESIENFLEMFDNLLASGLKIKPIYIGNIFYYFNKKEERTIDIVDGQQRITTIHILLFAIRNIINNNSENIENDEFEEVNEIINCILFKKDKEPRIYHSSKRERDLFKKMVEYSKEKNNNSASKSQNIFLRNYRYIHDWLIKKNRKEEYRKQKKIDSNLKSTIIDIIDIINRHLKIAFFC